MNTDLQRENDLLRRENEVLRERLLVLETEEADRLNPDVIILQGKVNKYGAGGEYCAWSVDGKYLMEELEAFFDKVREARDRHSNSDLVTIGWHVTDEPKTGLELDANLARMVLGQVETTFEHAYSDLTGYLWTTEKFKGNGRDILEELHLDEDKYLYLRAQVYSYADGESGE